VDIAIFRVKGEPLFTDMASPMTLTSKVHVDSRHFFYSESVVMFVFIFLFYFFTYFQYLSFFVLFLMLVPDFHGFQKALVRYNRQSVVGGKRRYELPFVLIIYQLILTYQIMPKISHVHSNYFCRIPRLVLLCRFRRKKPTSYLPSFINAHYTMLLYIKIDTANKQTPCH